MHTENIRELRLFVKEICKKYNISFILDVAKNDIDASCKEQIKLLIKNSNGIKLYYCEIPICSQTNNMIDNTITEISDLFKI